MRNWSQECDNEQECSYWNSRLKREITRYQEATKKDDVEAKRDATLEILALFDEESDYEIETVNRFADTQQYIIARDTQDILTGKWKPTYERLQADWNRELSEALEQGELISTLKLVKIGKKLAFIRNPEEPHTEYFCKVKKMVNSISNSIDRDLR